MGPRVGRVLGTPTLVAALLLVLASCTSPALQSLASAQSESAGYRAGTPVPRPYAMPDQTLTDTSGQPYNLTSSPSRPATLMFFGYTHCPDVCPGVLNDVALALLRLDPGVRDQIQVVFVTTDPGRDSPKQIRAYLDRFNPDFVGLTGPVPTIKEVAGRVGVEIEERQRLAGGGYEVGHSAQVIGFSRTRGVVFWTPETAVGDLRADFALLVDRSR